MPKPGGLIVSESGAVTDTEVLSVTLMLKLLDPAVLAVPDIVPPERLSPDGSDPLATDHE